MTFPLTGFNGFSMPSLPTSWGASSGSGGSAFPSLSSFKLPSMTGATGNTLYPSPSSSGSSFSFPSLSSFGSLGRGSSQSMGGDDSSSAFPSLSNYFPSLTKQPGGITGGSGQAPTWNLPSLGGGSSAAGSSGSAFPSLGSWPGLGSAASSGGSTGTKTSPPIFNPSSNMSMPGGFASQLFGGGMKSPLATSAYGSSAGVTGAKPQSYTSPAALTGANAQAINHEKVTQGGLTYTPLANTGAKATEGPPPLHVAAANPAPGSFSTATDQYGRQFVYAKSVDSSGGGQVVGVSSNGTVLKQTTTGDGKVVIYDTGAAAAQPRAATPTVAVGRPTQATQPKSQPVVIPPKPSAYYPSQPPPPKPSQDDIDAANQGRWLG